MNRQRFFRFTFVMVLLVLLCGTVVASVSASRPGPDAHTRQDRPVKIPATPRGIAAGQPLIVDHTSVNINAVPQHWIEEAKRTLHIAYGHTSHGSQLTSGMSGLVGFANGGGHGLDLPDDIFAWNNGGTGGALDLHDYAMGGDVGYYPQWVSNTIDYLGTPDPVTGRGMNNPDVNVIIWSWCGQASGRTEQTMLDTYLLPMTQLEIDYPGVTFVYMTGHADGGGEEGNLHQRNQQIRDYCIANDKVLFDFYDIELYDPDVNYYGDRYVLDSCQYDGDGDGNPWNDTTNWAIDWQDTHTQDVDWYSVSCAHSQALNCNQKGYATWWLWARLAGWSGSGSQLTASTDTAVPGQTITYTIVVRDTGAPLTSTVYVTDVLPSGLTYQPGSLTATAGTVSDADAPTLRWSGVLTPTPVVTATYAVTVSADVPQVIVNSAIFVVPGYPPITSTATVTIVWPVNRPDLTPSYKTVSSRHVEYGERITYTIGIQNSTGPLAQTVLVTDVIPGGLSYVPGTLTATAGSVDDASAPILYWSGVLTPTPNITVTYAVTVTHPATGTLGTVAFPLVNAATIVAPGYDPITRTVTVWANPYRVFLPLVLKNGTGGTLIWR